MTRRLSSLSTSDGQSKAGDSAAPEGSWSRMGAMASAVSPRIVPRSAMFVDFRREESGESVSSRSLSRVAKRKTPVKPNQASPLDAEEAILAAMLMAPSALADVCNAGLQPGHFSDRRCAKI